MALRSVTLTLRLAHNGSKTFTPTRFESLYRQKINPQITTTRWFSHYDKKDSSNENENETSTPNNPSSLVLYEGPFSALSLRLKRVSITTCILGLVGLPLLIVLHGADAPTIAQITVGGTATFAACGSTVALSYCFSPYVHTLEKVDSSTNLIQATTRNIFAMKVETVFDPEKDVVTSSGQRPFCNFIAKGVPMYVHPELLMNETLRVQLLGEIPKSEKVDSGNQDDDLF